MRIGIVGCTGAVGQQMLRCLEERKLEVEELRLFASANSVGKEMQFHGASVVVEDCASLRFENLDYVLGAVEAEISKDIAHEIVKQGAIYIDNSSAFRMDEQVPLVVPEVNGADALNHKGILSNPNCSTIISMVAIHAINQCSTIEKMIVSTYQAVSGAGVKGMQELNEQIRNLGQGVDVVPTTFSRQIAYNCIPLIGLEDEFGFTSEEMKMQNEGRRILHNPDLRVNCTCVRVPVMRSHSISITCITENELDVNDVKKSIATAKGVILMDTPTPLDASNKDKVLVGRVRKDNAFEHGISLWCVGDQIRKGAATNAIQIIEVLEKGN